MQQDPLLCLMIAQAYFGRAMTRQSDNRNYQISQVCGFSPWRRVGIRVDAQGLAFLTKYRKFSGKDQLSQEEVEFNYGRAFHGIGELLKRCCWLLASLTTGVPHLAMKHYEFVLQSIQNRMNEAGPEYAEVGLFLLRIIGNGALTMQHIRNESLSYEVAHNLMQLYAAVGNMALVKEKSAWLAI